MLARRSCRSVLTGHCRRRLLPTYNSLYTDKNRFLSTISEFNLHQYCVPVTTANKLDESDTTNKSNLTHDLRTKYFCQVTRGGGQLFFESHDKMNVGGNDRLLSMSMKNSSSIIQNESIRKTSDIKHARAMPSTLTSSYPFSTGILKNPGMDNPSFYRTAQNVISRAENNMQSSGKFNYCSMNTLRSFSSAPASKEDEKEDHTRMENRNKSSTEVGNFKSTSSPKLQSSSTTATSKHSPFSTSVVVETNDSWSATKILDKTKSLIISSSKTIASFIIKFPGVMFFYLTHPKEFKFKMSSLMEAAKKEAHHYYMGSKLLAADIRTARHILGRTLEGNALSRRERKQLLRTVTDLFRVVPMSIFVLVPFLEFALPFALKLFPNMLPSTFQDSLKAEEAMKKELKTRLAMAEFFQETLQNLAKDHRKRYAKKSGNESESVNNERQETAASFLEFIDKARKGEMLPPDVIIKYSSYFKDELTLDNIPRMQLVNMCKYMNILPYGSEALLRFQLRHKIRTLQEDDQRILWEGIDSLTKMELREACQERGMRSTGLSKDSYKRALQQWLDLSVNKNVPISLLIMSRTFFLRDEMARPSRIADESKSLAGLADTISGLDKDVVNEVVLEVATSEEKKSSPEVLAIKLEVLETQNELIEEENKERDAAAAAKKKAELEKLEKDRVKDSTSIVAEGDSLTSKEEIIAKEPSVEQSIAESSIEKEKSDIDTQDTTVTKALDIDHEMEGKEKVSDQESGEKSDQEEKDKSLSSEEIDAISQLVSPDPVSAEKEALERIKAAMAEKDDDDKIESPLDGQEQLSADSEKIDKDELNLESTLAQEQTQTPSEGSEKEEPILVTDEEVAAVISKMDEKVAKEADASTTVSFDTDETREEIVNEEQIVVTDEYVDEKLEKVISRLKSKVESMVGKIEIQLSDVEAKIGNKFHLLDKDMDGVLSREEMAICLQSVLKRKLTVEEAMEIAKDMDKNEDGFFSIEELNKWLETNRLVKLVNEGRDAEVDKMIEIQASKLKEKQEANEEEKRNHLNDDQSIKQ